MAMTRKRKTILASIGAVVLVFFVYLLIDESLRPEVNADLEYKPAYVDPKQNGYYAYLGLRAEPGMDPWQAGWKVQQVFDRYLADGGSEDNIPVEKYTWVDHIELKSGNMRQYFGCGGGDCFSAVKFHRTIVAESLPQYQEVLARYNKMQTYPAFQETVAAPGLTGRILLHQLFQAKVSLMWQTGKKQTALQMLIDDLAYWRRISVNDTGMTMKMVISAMIDVDMKLYGALISSDMTFLAKQGLPQQITNAFTTQELSLQHQFRREFQRYAQIIRRIHAGQQDGNPLFKLLFFKQNATINALHTRLSSVVSLNTVPWEKFPEAYIAHKAWLNTAESESRIYNHVGNMLVEIAKHPYESYIVQMHFTEALRRLVVLKYHLNHNGIKISDIPAWLSKQDKSLGHLYTAEPAGYDKDRNELYFDMSMVNGKKVRLTLQ